MPKNIKVIALKQYRNTRRKIKMKKKIKVKILIIRAIINFL